MTNFELQTIKNEILEMAPLATLAVEKCQNNLPKLHRGIFLLVFAVKEFLFTRSGSK